MIDGNEKLFRCNGRMDDMVKSKIALVLKKNKGIKKL